jgi:aminoglycoside phosphotransferase (APT) family kinase protein
VSSPSPDVVRSKAEAAALERPPLLILDELTRFLDMQGLGEGPVRGERIGEGQSNVTFRLQRGEDVFVLRRGPRPPLPPSAHDMERESRILRFVAGAGIPVPRVLAVCADPGVLGVPFYVMSHVSGVVVTDELPPSLAEEHARRAASEALVDLLAAVHQVPVDSAEARALGRPEGYLARQVERFTLLWHRNTTRELPEVERIGRWLGDRVPRSPHAAVVHGDFRMGNVMYDAHTAGRVVALLDWELSTIGDPLADLGYLVATYADAGSVPSVMELTSVTRRPGFLDRHQLVERYAAASDLDVTALGWYETLALWKAAVFCEAIFTRWLRGERPDDRTFAPRLEHGVPQLLELAAQAAGRGR